MIASHVLTRPLAAALVGLALSGGVQAATVQVKVSVENLAPANGISFAPLRLAFHGGAFDTFDLGSVATAPIISVAEGGSGNDWFAALAVMDPTATPGSVLPVPLLPGGTGSGLFTVDTAVNPFFSFGAMVIPSNDFFIGNDDPQEYRLFDAAGNLAIASITQGAREIWDAGSEIYDPAAAAFVGNNGLRTDQNSVVAFNFAELAAFNGLTTAAGYTLNSQLAANSDVYRISFEIVPVPEPGTYALMAMGLGMIGWAGQRARRRS